jgi:hypothetical protein
MYFDEAAEFQNVSTVDPTRVHYDLMTCVTSQPLLVVLEDLTFDYTSQITSKSPTEIWDSCTVVHRQRR